MGRRLIKVAILFAGLVVAFAGCGGSGEPTSGQAMASSQPSPPKASATVNAQIQNRGRVIHVVVALCDNESQGIVPVPASIGNGDDPKQNLYWGAGFGVKNFFRKQRDWRFLQEQQNPRSAVLERVVFRHQKKNVYLIADAYRGREIKQATLDFLRFSAGSEKEIIDVRTDSQSQKLSIGGGADLIAYVGHDGLMDFKLPEHPQRADERRREAIILACASKLYFEEPLRQTGAEPLLWTTNLMAPEAYVLKAAVDGWMLDESGEKVRRRAAEAYHRYQNCGIRGALNLFATGW
jgi:hypothetical protein